MAIMNFSVPDDVKKSFNKVFSGENKSAVIARLMREAIEKKRSEARRSKAIDALLRKRQSAKVVRARTLTEARRQGRP